MLHARTAYLQAARDGFVRFNSAFAREFHDAFRLLLGGPLLLLQNGDSIVCNLRLNFR
jgi:hypothetical protein